MATPSRRVLAEQARRLLERARSRAGVAVDEMVRLVGEFQPRGAATRRSWYDWQERPETVSLLTGLAAIHMLGPEATFDVLFGKARPAFTKQELDWTQAEPATDVEDRLTKLEERLGALMEVVAKLQEASDLQRRLLQDLMTARLVPERDPTVRARSDMPVSEED